MRRPTPTRLAVPLAAVLLTAALSGLLGPGPVGGPSRPAAVRPYQLAGGPSRPPPTVERPPAPEAAIGWRRSRALGEPFRNGRLVNGVQLPAETSQLVTWDPVRDTLPNRGWRRWGTDRLVRTVLAVAAGYAADHPDAPRLVVGDLSRPRGGDFGRRYGGDGHRSHQNGLDVDVYYPRRDGRELAPRRVGQVDRALAQDLVDRFVRAGAEYVFVGPHTGLRGPRKVVSPLWNHDDHLHVRLRPNRSGRGGRGGR
jgi:murein endopeptidase